MTRYRTLSVCGMADEYSHLVSPVGQMVEIGARNEIKFRFCTGFNILSGQYFLTAGHCLTSNSTLPTCIAYDYNSVVGRGDCVINFGYENCNLGYWDTRVESLKFVQDGSYSRIKSWVDHGYCNGDLDYAVLSLTPEAAMHGSFELSSERLYQGTPLLVVQHPEGYPKQYSLGQINGRGVLANTFEHSAHTEGGSSGAPVISRTSSEVIGVHVAGNSQQTIHTAVMARSIVQDAAQRNQRWVQPYVKTFGLFKPEPLVAEFADPNKAIKLYEEPKYKSCCF